MLRVLNGAVITYDDVDLALRETEVDAMKEFGKVCPFFLFLLFLFVLRRFK